LAALAFSSAALATMATLHPPSDALREKKSGALRASSTVISPRSFFVFSFQGRRIRSRPG